MASKSLFKLSDLYFVPLFLTIPIKTVTNGYEEYIKNKDKSFTEHTFHCCMGALCGIYSGAFLGIVWPVSFPLFITRLMNEDKDKDKDKK